MTQIKRYSPVQFKATPLKTVERDNWQIVTKYNNEGPGPWIVDLSHCLRLDLQSVDLPGKTPFGITIPETIGQSVLANGCLINRMNNTQASIYHVAGEAPDLPGEPEYTDVTENTLFVAIIGQDTFKICEKLSSLDFTDPGKQPPFLFQGPFSHVPCQIVTVSREKGKEGLVLTCSRGYGRDMIHAVMDAGEEFGLTPAGEGRFASWIGEITS